MFKILGVILMTIGILIPASLGEKLPAFFQSDLVFLSALGLFIVLVFFFQTKMKNDNQKIIERANSKVPNFL
ncbi:hypothetical protein [Poseidonibacter ostreae]|uniref:Uncharacterized protein n=1 Tax=Poseidonibacter ostreae TaxID=2654171 RepID=A0A6L4WV64_9BACT|nr:hypothetical protein [Poseidonibacter ostreae]KAB7889553.1 hypothetical protein GBG19_05720 [Poseidonibacter ostreae]